jgi:MinD superfamily P-loop ATPase
MKIAIASGKGGTGKTTVATNLAAIASRGGRSVAYLDCDVEEPNGHLFLLPQFADSRPVGVLVPQVDADACTGCGKCGELCQYSAIVSVGKTVLVYPELCHGCGGCVRVCRPGAIREVLHETGTVQTGAAGDIRFVQGLLHIGQVMSPPVIRAVKSDIPPAELVILDSPPGTSCPVIESLRDTDGVVLVTEPTPFGLNDLKLAVAMVRELRIPFGVIINCAGPADDETREYCSSESIAIFAEIPDDRRIAEAYSRGQLFTDALVEYQPIFTALLERLSEEFTPGGGAKDGGR